MAFKKLLTVLIVSVFFITGCQWNNDGTNQNDDGTVEQTRTTRDEGFNDRNFTQNVQNRNRDNTGVNRNSNNRQDRFEVSEEAAERIVAEVPEIERAYVLTTRNNAYVAATLNKSERTGRDRLSRNDPNSSSAGMNVRNVNDRNVKNRTVNEGDANDRRSDNHMANRRDVESDEVSDEVKNKIADIVQDVDDDIENVYVSTSPDFFNLTNNYVDDFNNGRPVEGFFDQIGNMIERIFPQNKR